MHRAFRVVLALALLPGVVGWSAGQRELEQAAEVVKTEFPNSWENYRSEPITLSVFMDTPSPIFIEHVEEATLLIPKILREETGVTLDVRQAVDSSDQSLNLIIASGDYPDLMFVNTTRQAAGALVENDQVWAFDVLGDRYGIDLTEHLNVNQRFSIRSRFGMESIHYLTAYGWHDEHMDSPWIVKWQSGSYVNEKWYKEVGSPRISSMDDVISVSKMIRAKNPRFEFPVFVHRAPKKGPFNEPAEAVRLVQYFGLNDPTTYWSLGEEHKFNIQAPAYIDLVKFLNRLVFEEMINPLVWTGSKSDKLGLVFTGQVAFVLNGDGDNLAQRNSALQQKYADESWTMLPPFSADPDKYEFTPAGSIGAGAPSGWAMPKTGQNDLRRLVLLDYLTSDHFQKLNAFGREGSEHTIVEGIPTFTAAFNKLGRAELRDQYGFNIFSGAIRDDYWDMIRRQQQAPEMREAIEILRPAIDRFHDLTFVPEAVSVSYPADSQENKIYSEIKEVFGDEMTKIILNSRPDEVESNYRALLQKVEGMGLGELNAFQRAAAERFQDTVNKYKF